MRPGARSLLPNGIVLTEKPSQQDILRLIHLGKCHIFKSQTTDQENIQDDCESKQSLLTRYAWGGDGERIFHLKGVKSNSL